MNDAKQGIPIIALLTSSLVFNILIKRVYYHSMTVSESILDPKVLFGSKDFGERTASNDVLIFVFQKENP